MLSTIDKKFSPAVIAAAFLIFGFAVFASRPALADLTIVSTMTVDGLTTAANGNQPPPNGPMTYTTYIQGNWSRLAGSDGSVYLFDASSQTVYELNAKTQTYSSESYKKFLDYTTVFPPVLAKRLKIAEDLNFFSDSSSATYLNTAASKTEVTGGAHFLIEKPANDNLDGSGGSGPNQHHSGGDPGSDNDGGAPGAGLPGSDHPVNPGGMGTGLPMSQQPVYTGRDGTGAINGSIGSGGDASDNGNNGGGDASTGSDTSSGADTPPSDKDDLPLATFRKAHVPDFYVTGSIWQAPAYKLPKQKKAITVPIALEMGWAGGPFLGDLAKWIDDSHEVPLHSEFLIKEAYTQPNGNSNILLDCNIKTTFDVQSIVTAPLDPTLFAIPTGFTLQKGQVNVPQLSMPYIDQQSDDNDAN